ncbi:hypothetical protein UlMin_035236 [Ulmus minor]
MVHQVCKLLVISHSIRSNFHFHGSPLRYSISTLLFSTFQPQKSVSEPPIPVAQYLINHHQFSPEAASKASSNFPHLKNPQKSDLMFSYLKERGFSHSQLEEVVRKFPNVLVIRLKNIKSKIKIFQEMGFSPNDIADIISADPEILKHSTDYRLRPSILALNNIMGSHAAVCRLLKSSGFLMKYDLSKTMIPNIEFMKCCGISFSQIISYVYHFPRVFLLKTKTIVNIMKRVDEMGFDRKSRLLLQAIRTLSSMTLENWKHKLNLFRELGFSEDDILLVFRRNPQVFCVSEKKIKEVADVLITAGNIDISYVVKHPELLMYSLEKRIIPRLGVIEILEEKNILKKRPSLSTIVTISSKMFSERYVLPHSNELGVQYVTSWGS